MKKVISMLVALFIALSMVSAFAAVEPDTEYPSLIWKDDFSKAAECVGTSVKDAEGYSLYPKNSPIGLNSDHPANYEVSNGEFAFTRADAENKKTGLSYLFFQKVTVPEYSFGFDVKFSGIDELTNVASDNILGFNPGTEKTNVPDSGASATAWTFYKEGKRINFSVKRDADKNPIKDANDKIAIFVGDAQLSQDKYYTIKVSVYSDGGDFRKYRAVIIDDQGVVHNTGITGKVQNAFIELYKIDASIQTTLVAGDAKVYYDNLFTEIGVFDLSVPSSFEPNADNTVSYSATIPVDMKDVKAYINDTKVEDITLVDGVIDYNITSVLPDDTTLGNVKFELRGTLDGEELSIVKYGTYSRILPTGKSRIVDTPVAGKSPYGLRLINHVVGKEEKGSITTMPAETPDYWELSGYGQLDIANLTSTPFTGIVDFSFDFRSATVLNQIRIRLTANISNGKAFLWDGGTDTYTYLLSNGKFAGEYDYELNDWNTVRVRTDFINHKYEIFLNDTLTRSGVFTDVDAGDGVEPGNVSNQIVDARIIFTTADEQGTVYAGKVDVDNFKFIEYTVATGDADVNFNYANGSSEKYEGEALTAVNLTGFEFILPSAFENISAKIVNEAGDTVPVTFTSNGNILSGAYSGPILPDGNYKLIIDKTATLGGEALGVDYATSFAIASHACIIAPDEGASFIDKVNLSAYLPDVDSVMFYINNKQVKTFDTANDDNIYNFEYIPADMGVKTFDVYTIKDGKFEVLTTDFVTTDETEIKVTTADCDTKAKISVLASAEATVEAGAGVDGLGAIKVASKLNRIIDDVEVTNTSNSNASITMDHKYRVMVTEFNIKPCENTYVALEHGYGLDGKTYSEDATQYRTLHFRGTNSNPLFGSDGKILATDKTFTPGVWYNVKQIINLEDLTVSYVVKSGNEEILNITDDISGFVTEKDANAYPNWRENIVATYKYRICLYPIDKTLVTDDAPAAFYLDNCKRYEPVALPLVDTINGEDGDVIVAGTDEISIALTCAYDNDDVSAFNEELITVLVNGKEYNEAVVNITDGANFAVSGLAEIKAGSLIEIKVSGVAFFGNKLIGKELTIPVYVSNADGICVLPFNKLDGDNEFTAFAKYINTDSEVDSYLVFTELNGGKIAKTKFVSSTISANGSGVVFGAFGADAANCKINLWSKNLAPLLGTTYFAE